MYSEPFRHWFVLAVLLAGFLLSWQWAYGFSSSQIELQGGKFQTAELVLTVDNQLPSCARLQVFWLNKGDGVSITVRDQVLELAALSNSVQSSFALVSQCQRETITSLPVLAESSLLEIPQVVASSSAGMQASVDGGSFFIQLASGSGVVRLETMLATQGDGVSLDFTQITEISDSGSTAGSLGTAFADQLVFQGDSGSSTRLVFTNMLQPSLPAHIQPVVGCKTEASLYFPSDQNNPCRLFSGFSANFPPRQAKGKQYFLQQPDGTFSSLPQPSYSKPTKAGEVIMSEVMWAGDDPWLELYNSTETRFQLRGLSILGAGSNGGALLVNVDLFVEPFGYAIVGRRSGSQSLLRQDPDWVTPNFSLWSNNAELILRAQNGVELDRTPVGPWLKGSGTPPLASVQRRFSEMPGENWENWETCASVACDYSAYWKMSTDNRGSPWQPTVL